MLTGKEQSPLRAERQRHDDGALSCGRVHDREGVGGELPHVVLAGRPAGAAVAAPVEGEDTAVAGDVGDLHLPVS